MRGNVMRPMSVLGNPNGFCRAIASDTGRGNTQEITSRMLPKAAAPHGRSTGHTRRFADSAGLITRPTGKKLHTSRMTDKRAAKVSTR